MSYSASIAKIAEKSGVDFALDFPIGLKTTYKTGGKADGALFPSSLEQAKSVVDLLKHSDKIKAIARYHDIHKTSLMDSKRMVERIEEDIEKYSKRDGKK